MAHFLDIMIRVKKLDIFIAKQFGLLFIGTFLISQFVLMMQFLWRFVDELIGKGLPINILAEFFWYMSLILVPQALPLAILLSSLITFGNLGESSELTAIKAAGISLMQAFRSITVIVILISCISFYFQNVIGPQANMSFARLLVSMKQTSPELEIPEGVFYDGIPNSNIYVQKKDMDKGMLYGIMIYQIGDSYEDAEIILADSGRLQSTAEKKHLLLNLYSGKWFRNLKSQNMAGNVAVPYSRETFASKRIVLDFDGEFNMADENSISNNAMGKSLKKISHDIDSLKDISDSIGHAFFDEAKHNLLYTAQLSASDSVRAVKLAAKNNFDTIYNRLDNGKKLSALQMATDRIQMGSFDMDMKSSYTYDMDKLIRKHQLEAINKFTLSLSCLIFFFIGAPLGAIIRKGGLGVPVIISVIVFIIYYIFDNSGSKMARDGNWDIWFGKLISMAVLTPMAIFFTYKANKDSVVFNMDAYQAVLMRIFGLRQKRHIYKKEVIIYEPKYLQDRDILQELTTEIKHYSSAHSLIKAPNPIRVFFKEGDDHVIREVNSVLESIIEDLSNTKDKIILSEINNYPILATHAHTRPFKRKSLNIITAVIIPLGIFFYLRMWRFRLRLLRDLRMIVNTNNKLITRINEINK